MLACGNYKSFFESVGIYCYLYTGRVTMKGTPIQNGPRHGQMASLGIIRVGACEGSTPSVACARCIEPTPKSIHQLLTKIDQPLLNHLYLGRFRGRQPGVATTFQVLNQKLLNDADGQQLQGDSQR